VRNLNAEIDMHTRITPYEGEGRNQGDSSRSQRNTKVASRPPEVRREAWNRCPLPQKEPILLIT